MSQRAEYDAGPHHCDKCKATFQQTPWALPLMDLRFPESLRFCSEQCLDLYVHDHANNIAPVRGIQVSVRTEKRSNAGK